MCLSVKLVQRQDTVQSRPLRLENMIGLLVGLFRSWFKSDYPVTRNGKPKIGLKHCNKVDKKRRLLKDNIAFSHIISLSLSFIFFGLDFKFVGIGKERRSPSGLRCWQ